MLYGKDGKLSLTKIITLTGYIIFIIMSIIILFHNPEKFDYKIFAILTGGSSAGLRMYDKLINNKFA